MIPRRPTSGAAILVCSLLASTNGFLPPSFPNRHGLQIVGIEMNTRSNIAPKATAADECGCQSNVKLSGKPSESARRINHRETIRKKSIFNLDGQSVTMDELIEFILQWSKRVDELKELGVNLVLVSIGKPEVGKRLVKHLELQDGDQYLYVDPENALYVSLQLNQGVKETFFSVETPFAFLDRFTKPDGMKELGKVLSKWNKAVFIPPKQQQAFNQGGTFLFDGAETIFAHYDASTGAHSNIQEVVDLAKERLSLRAKAGGLIGA